MTLPVPHLRSVCILTETYFPVVGGGETQARLLAEALSAHGIAVMVMTRRSSKDFDPVEQIRDVTVYRLPPAGPGQLKKWGLLLSSLPALIRLRNQFDLIFVSGFRIIGMAAVVVGKLFSKPVVLKADSQGEMSGDFFAPGLEKIRMRPHALPFSLFLRLRNRLLKGADAFVAITPEGEAELRHSSVEAGRIHTIPNAVDTSRFSPVSAGYKRALRANLQLPVDSCIVAYAGRLVSYKGLPLLLRVWKEFCRSRGNARLVLLGSGGLDMHNCEEELRQFVATHHLHKTVVFTGDVPNVETYLQAADIFAFPTENDAFPSALVEAMSCGLAVVSTPVGAITTIISHEQTGLLVQPGNFEQLFDALERLSSDSGLAARLGVAARQSVTERYSAEAVTQDYMNLFLGTTAARSANSLSARTG